MATVEYGGKSPYEVAEQEGRLEDFLKYTKELYSGSTPQTTYPSTVNLYKPETYATRDGQPWQQPAPPPTPAPPQVSTPAIPTSTPSPQVSGGGGSSQSPQPTFHNTFNDPLTAQYEKLLQSQLALFQQQQAAMQAAAQQADQRRSQTASAVDRLSQFINQRVSKLQGPAYTGTEAEVLRTQLLDPIERDRSASQKRALEQIARRGIDPSSGIAQELMRIVDREFDEFRAKAQGSLASRQIDEQRSREQEAQGLLQYLAMLPDAIARGDLDFVSYVQNLVAQPGQHGIAIGDVLAELPTRRLNDALATLGIAPNISGTSSTALQLLQQAQNQRYMNQQQAAQAWGNIGRSFMP